ncbi:hypothetical protein [Alkalimonas mucilaginosa]|uniref:ATP synthase protein I n=1 Tax=Alkalimonas mucilaginosa TaxID=3057676 RepID=A0ABU7JCS6_9GAMM|nr:hypothetical protein [Alkalimonas sp. MEB004]MEE2023460.1 hypothetical protein [Alkalimonas sp. MEB004]
MLSREQAEVAAEALLKSKRQQLARKQANRQKWRLRRHRMVASFIGFIMGTILGDYFAGDPYPWNLIGLAIGLVFALLGQHFGRPEDKPR